MTAPMQLSVLLCEDSEDDCFILSRSLRKGGYAPEVHRVETESALREALASGSWDLVISDYRMPGFTARDAIRTVREGHPDLPIIVVSGTVGEDLAVECMRLGANDYVMKGNLTRLLPAIARELREAEIRRERKLAEGHLELSHELLDLANRHASLDMLLPAFVESIRRFTGCDGVAVRVVDEAERFPVLAAMGCLETPTCPPPSSRPLEKHASPCPCSRVLTECIAPGRATDAPLSSLLLDGPHLGKTAGFDAEAPTISCILSRPDLHSAAVIPFAGGGRVLGLIIIVSLRPPAITPSVVAAVERAAMQLGTAVHRLRTEASLRDTLAQLNQAQKMEAVGRLAGGIAHDFNNLVGAIIGNCELALASLEIGDRPTEELQQILEVSDRAAALTSRLLAFGRKQILRLDCLDLNEVVRTFENLIRRVIGEDVALRIRLCDETCTFMADRNQMEQILMNLVVNARDAMPDGGSIRIETACRDLDAGFVATHVGARPGPHAILTIRDTGSGIAPDVQEHVFEPFFTTKALDKGTGLGLSTVYGIVKQSDGYIWIESELGAGTSFHLAFPLAGERPVPKAKVSVPRDDPRGNELILFVEDEKLLLDVMANRLEAFGYRILRATSPEEALEVFAAHEKEIDLLLTDVVMPRMNGADLARSCLARRPELPVLFTSGYTENAIVHHGVLDADVDFIAKPFRPRELIQKIREILDRRGERDGIATSTATPAPEDGER